MKNISSDRSTTRPSVALFREDLDQILDIMNHTCEGVSITDSEFEYESLDELQKIKGHEPSSLTLKGHNPYLNVNFRRFGTPGVSLYADSSENAHTSFLKIVEVLDQRRSKLGYILDLRLWVLPFVVFVVLVNITDLVPSVYWRLLILLVLFMGAYYSHLSKYGFFTSIVLLRRHERESFFRRNAQTIIVAIVSVIAGAFAIELVKWIMTLFYSGSK